MDGLTVAKANRYLESGGLDSKSMKIESGSSQIQTDSVGSAALGKSFADTLKDAVGNVNELQKTADRAAQDLASGRTDNVAEVMIAAEKADIAVKLMMQVRNKIIDAYQEVMKMQV